MYEEVNSLKIINIQPTLTGVDLSFIYFYVKNELSVNSVVNTDERTFVYTYNQGSTLCWCWYQPLVPKLVPTF